MLFLNENCAVAVGHDCTPVSFVGQGGNWKYGKKLDTGSSAPASGGDQKSAFDVFKGKVDRAEAATETKLNTKHQNAITNIQKYHNGYSTSSLDGCLLVWDAPK